VAEALATVGCAVPTQVGKKGGRFTAGSAGAVGIHVPEAAGMLGLRVCRFVVAS